MKLETGTKAEVIKRMADIAIDVKQDFIIAHGTKPQRNGKPEYV